MKKANYLNSLLLMLAFLLSGTAAAHDFEVNGIYYNVNGNEATITYRGTSSHEYYDEYSGYLNIPTSVTYNGTTYSVTCIGTEAFMDCMNLTSILIPNSITSIGDFAFGGCTGLTSIDIPNSVTTIGPGVFLDCKGLTSIDIPNSVTTIGSAVFSFCTGLASIAIPNSITSIGDFAFGGCTGLTSIDIPNSVTTIGSRVFSGCTGLASITIPNSVTTIGSGVFSGCTGLESISIPNSVTTIGRDAFDNTAWYNDQPDGVVYAALLAYVYKGTMPEGTNITLIDGTLGISECAFENCTGLTSIDIPNSVISIDDYAFHGCTGLTSIDIPNSVTTIGSRVFSDCTGLESITIPNSVTTIGRDAFDNTAWYNDQPDGVVYAGLLAYVYKGTMPEGTNITLIDGTLGISERAFENCTGLTSIDIPNSVISIDDYAFHGCTGLTSIDIPNSVISIDDYAFHDCTGLTSIDIPNSVTTIGSGAFCGCHGLTNITLPIAITSISTHTFEGCSKLTSITIPNSVTTIGQQAFAQCYELTSIRIPNTVTTIGQSAFSACRGLTSITVANDNPIFDSRNNCNAIIETSTNTLLYGCRNTVILNTITSIGRGAFSACSGLTNIIIPNSVTSIGQSAFSSCWGLTSIIIPNSVTHIGSNAFSYCSGLSSVTIPNSVTIIGPYAFARCNKLTSVYIGNSVIRIDENAFLNNDAMTDVFCFANNPVVLYSDIFSNYDATLHVPAASLAAYFTAPYWCNFENIVGDALAPTEITISKDSVNLQLDEHLQLTAMVTPDNASNKEINWFSTDTTVATVNNGVVLAVGYGECDIIASCFGMQAICHVIVANRITLDQQESMLLPNHILTLTPTPIIPEIYVVSSSDPTVAAARVVSDGKVQVVGIKEGTTTITVGSTDGLAIPATCLVTVYTEPGDLNSDGFVNISDVTSLIDYILGGDETSVTMKNADVNGDGRINIADVTSLIDTILSKSE